MKTSMQRFSAAILLAVNLLMVAAPAFAEDTAIIDGVRFTYTNTCVVTINPDGTISIDDCCGGRVHIHTHAV